MCTANVYCAMFTEFAVYFDAVSQVDHEKQEIVVRTSNKKYYKRTASAMVFHGFLEVSCIIWMAKSLSTMMCSHTSLWQRPFFRAQQKLWHVLVQADMGMQSCNQTLSRIQVPDLVRYDLKFQDRSQVLVVSWSAGCHYWKLLLLSKTAAEKKKGS